MTLPKERTNAQAAEDESLIRTAKRLLQSRLEEVFCKTSEKCRLQLLQYQHTWPHTDAGLLEINAAIIDWRNRSMICVEEAFKSLVTENSPAEAVNLSWETIDEFFEWTADYRSNPSKFEEWQLEVKGSVFFIPDGFRPLSQECNNVPLQERLACDFRTQFEKLLNRLRDEALLNASTVPSPNTLQGTISQALPIGGTAPTEKQEEAANFLRFDGNLWAVRFEGGSVRHIPDLVGVQYISLILKQKLAEQPNLTSRELVELRYGREEESELESRDEVLPLLDTKIVKDRLDEIEAELQKTSSASEIEGLIDEKTKIQKYLGNGRIKSPGADRTFRQATFAGQAKQAQDAVRKAIKEAIEKMRADEDLVHLAAHLKANIKYGTTVSYVGSIGWTVETGVFPRTNP